MSTVQQGDRVAVHYTGKLEDGSVFDSSEGGEPIGFEAGSGELIPGFSLGVLGMAEGESKTLELEPEQAYGPRNADLVEAVAKDRMPGEVSVGDQLMAEAGDGTKFPVRVVGVTDDEVTLDGNHPLAGEKLIFEVTLVSILGGE